MPHEYKHKRQTIHMIWYWPRVNSFADNITGQLDVILSRLTTLIYSMTRWNEYQNLYNSTDGWSGSSGIIYYDIKIVYTQ